MTWEIFDFAGSLLHNPGVRTYKRKQYYGNMWGDVCKHRQGENVQRTGKAFKFIVDRCENNTRLETSPTAPGQSDAQPPVAQEYVAHHMQSYVPGLAEDVRVLSGARENGWSAGWTWTSPAATHGWSSHATWHQSSGTWWSNHPFRRPDDSSSVAAGGRRSAL